MSVQRLLDRLHLGCACCPEFASLDMSRRHVDIVDMFRQVEQGAHWRVAAPHSSTPLAFRRVSAINRPAMLIINDLSLRIAGRLLLDHASLTLPTGSKAGLVGRNGTGKTTLFNAITGESPARQARSACPRTRASARWRRKRPAPRSR